MRKLLFALSALAALFMIAPSNGYAQFVYQSMVGLYADDSVLDVHTGTTPGFQSENVYIVLTNPYLNVGLGEGESGNRAGDPGQGLRLAPDRTGRAYPARSDPAGCGYDPGDEP